MLRKILLSIVITNKISKCVFNARLYAFENEDTDVVNTYRREPKYGETIFYRNSFVEDDYLRGPESGNDKFLRRLDYNINCCRIILKKF